MTANMDVSLDEILAERKTERRGNRGRNDGGNRNDRNNDRGERNERNDRGGGGRGGGRRDRDRREDYPRDGVRKSYRDEPRKIDEEWVHDRYDNNDSEQHVKSSRGRASPERSIRSGTRVRVDNLHYDLARDDLEGLFSRIGPVTSVELVYDRAGRSEGIAYVTYQDHDDARAALREFDGANAKGQPIRLSIVPAGGRRGGNNASLGSGRPLADRISRPRKRNGEEEEDEDDEDGGRTSLAVAARRGIDRYVPGSGSTAGGGGGGPGSGRLSRSRSPAPRRRDGGGGRRPGERRGGGRNGRSDGQNGQNGGGGGGGNRRPRKTQEELDAEMADYFVEGSNGAAAAAAPAAEAEPAAAAAPAHDDGDDTDMIL